MLVELTDLKYLEYNRYIAYGETFETGEINLGGGQQLVVRSDHSDVNFLFHGSTVDESTANLGNNIFVWSFRYGVIHRFY